MAERLALPTSVHGVAGSNPAGGEILLEPKRRFIAQSLSCSPFHRHEMTEILLKGRKTLTHPFIVMPNSYPRDGIFNQHLTTIKDSYIVLCFYRHPGQNRSKPNGGTIPGVWRK